MAKMSPIYRFFRPILWQNEDEKFYYSIGGTANIVRYRDHFFLLSAQHSLTRQGYTVADLRIPYRISSEAYLQLGRGVDFSLAHQADEFSCVCDVQIHLIGGTSCPETPLAVGEFLDITSFESADSANARFLTGFPVEDQWQRYEEKILGGKGKFITGADEGPTNDPFCRFFRSPSLIGKDADGFSGGLITSISQSKVQLEGICLQGGGNREIDFVRFLSVEALQHHFMKAWDLLRPSESEGQG